MEEKKTNKKVLIILSIILIILITLVIIVINITQRNYGVDEIIMGMSQQEKQIFNTEFEDLQSEKASGTNIKALISAVIRSNDKEEALKDYYTEPKQVGITTIGILQKDVKNEYVSDKLSSVRSQIEMGKTYKVELSYGINGLITEIIITKNDDVQKNTL